jgi:uncharacterized protein
MTIHPDKISIIEDIEYLIKLGFQEILISIAYNVKWNYENMKKIYEELSSFYISYIHKGKIPPLLATNRLLKRKHELVQGVAKPHTDGYCTAGKTLLGVSEEGELYPCHRFTELGKNFSIGNVFTGLRHNLRKPFLEVSTQMFQRKPECPTCNALEFCRGSCMAFNLTGTGDLFLPEESYCKDLQMHVKTVTYIYNILTKENNTTFKEFLDSDYRTKQINQIIKLLSDSK